MPDKEPVGLSWEEAAAEALAEEAALATESANSEQDEQPAVTDTTEQPASKSNKAEGDENKEVNLFDALDDADDAEAEQPEGDSEFRVVNGKQVSISELEKGYMRQDDYTEKTTALAREREELTNAKALWDAVQENPVQTLTTLLQRARQGTLKTSAPVTSEQQDIDAIVQAKVQEALASNPSFQKIASDVTSREESEAFESIESDFTVKLTDADKARVKAEAEKLGLKTAQGLRIVFGSLYQEAQNAAARRKLVEESASGRGRGTVGNEAKHDPHKGEKPKDVEEAWNWALEEMGLEELIRT